MLGPGHLETADIARRELRLFLSVAEQTGMDADRQHRSLLVSQDDWHRWLGILQDAPLPSRPALPLLLRRLGYVTSRMERTALPAHAKEHVDRLLHAGRMLKGPHGHGTRRPCFVASGGNSRPAD
jgi:hypothetical protein